MSRRPLLPLLALAALLALLPACRALSCYRCEDRDPFGANRLPSGLSGPAAGSSGLPAIPRCSGFDAGRDELKIERCLSQYGYDRRCAKIAWSGGEMRGCFDGTLDEGCVKEDGVSFCACTGDYCNSVGLTTPALLLLLLAALLAALYSA